MSSVTVTRPIWRRFWHAYRADAVAFVRAGGHAAAAADHQHTGGRPTATAAGQDRRCHDRAVELPPPAQAAFEAVEPLVGDEELVEAVEAGFADVYASLDPYREGDGFVSYTELTKADTRALAQEIDALAEELSRVPAQIQG